MLLVYALTDVGNGNTSYQTYLVLVLAGAVPRLVPRHREALRRPAHAVGLPPAEDDLLAQLRRPS